MINRKNRFVNKIESKPETHQSNKLFIIRKFSLFDRVMLDGKL